MSKTQHKLHSTLNNLPSNTKTTIIQLLNARLSDGLDLALITKQAHWNMKGKQFIAVHTMVDGFRDELDGFNDDMAERITALGGTALGTTQAISNTSKIEAYPLDIFSVTEHIQALTTRYAAFANAIRKAIDESDDAGDKNTADLFTGISRALDKQLWFLEAHNEPT